MNPFTYRSFDTKTFAPNEALPLFGVSFGCSVNGVGSFSGQLSLTEPAVQAIDWERASRPNQSSIIVDLGGVVVWGGIITSRRYSAGVVTITGSTFGAYFRQRLQSVDYSKPNPSNIYWAANPADPTVIAAQFLWDSQWTVPIALPGLSIPDAQIGGDGNAGTQEGVNVLINGDPPPNIAGGTDKAFIFNASNVVLIPGLLPGIGNGSSINDGGVHIPGGTGVTSAAQTNNSVRLGGCTIHLTNTLNTAIINSPHGTPRNGMILVGATFPNDLAVGCHITSVAIAAGAHNYTITMSGAATGTSTLVCAMSGYSTIVMTHNATATTYENVNYSSPSVPTPTPVPDWISDNPSTSQYQTVDSLLQNLSQMGYGPGFDYCFDVAYQPGSTIPAITLNIWYPRQGKSGAGATLLVNRAMMTSLDYSEDGTKQMFGIIETGSASGGIVSDIVEADYQTTSNGYPVLEGAISHSRVNDATMLTGIADGDLQSLQNPTGTMTITCPLDITGTEVVGMVSLADFVIGDDLISRIDPATKNELGSPIFGPANDPRFPDGLNFEWRINQWLATIADDGLSTVAFTLGIPPTDPGLGPPTPPPLS